PRRCPDRRRDLDLRGMARKVIAALLRVLLRIFFRRIEVVGDVPREPVIFAINHPNALVDPLFLLCFAPRPVSFLAKAPLFRLPLIGWFARALDAIPVYRRQDNAATAAIRVEIVPTGLFYAANQTFRSSALVYFGTPIVVEPEPVDANDEPRAESV